MAVAPTDIATALGRDAPTSVESTQWAMWIADALMLIGARLGALVDLDQARLDYVVREAVIHHIRHPDDATQVSENIGEYGYAKTYRSSRGRVTILDEWWALLAPEPASGAFSLDMAGAYSAHLAWCALEMGANYCSCGVSIAGYPIFEGAW